MSNGRIKFPINEPAEGKKNQIEEYRLLWRTWNSAYQQQMILSKRYRNWKQEEWIFICSATYVLWSYTGASWCAYGMMKEDIKKLKNHHGRCWWGRVFIANITSQYKIDQPCFEIIQRMGARVWAETLKHFGVNWENSNCEERYKKHYFTYCEKITNNQPISW
jgi:hypothetical protein